MKSLDHILHVRADIGDGLNCDVDDMIYVKLKVNIIFYQFHDRLLRETSLLQSLKPLLYMSFNDINHAMARLLAAVVSRQQFNSCLSTTSDTSAIQSKPKETRQRSRAIR